MRIAFNTIVILVVLTILAGVGMWVFTNAEQSGRETMSIEAAAEQSAQVGQFATVDGLKTHFTVSGAGEPLVLLHGFLGSTYSWHLVVPGLQKQYRVYALDLPGFGYTERSSVGRNYTLAGQATFVFDFLTQQGAQHAVVVGYGMGARAAMVLAQDQPQFVDRLVLVTPDREEVLPRRLQASLGVPYLPLAKTLAAFDFLRRSKLQDSLEAAYADPSRVNKNLVDQYYLPLRVKGTMSSLVTFMETDQSPQGMLAPSRVSVPTLIIWGEDDPLVSPDEAQKLAGQMPQARVALVSDAGHLPQEEQAPAVTDLMLRFLSEPR